MTKKYNLTTVRDMMSRMATSASSFDETAVVEPRSLFDLKSVYPLSKFRDSVIAENGGFVTQSEGQFIVSTTDDAGSSVIFQSVERARYVAGFDGVPGMAVALNALPTGNQVVEWGNTDFENGFVVGVDAEGMFTRLYSGGEVVKTRRRNEWNSPRLAELDPLDVRVYRMPYRWYASGPYRLMIDHYDEKDTPTVLPVDVMTREDTTKPITEDPNQPISLRIQNNGTASPLTARVMGRQYFVMGDYNPDKRIIGERRFTQTVDTTPVPLIAFRQKPGIYNSVSIKIGGIDLLVSGADIFFDVRVFADITGGEWISPRLTDNGVESAVEFNVSADSIAGSGLQIWGGGLVGEGQGKRSSLQSVELPSLDLPGDGEVICLTAQAISGSATVSSVLKVNEEW